MGATPTPVAYNETYLALQQNVADGEENPAASITSMKFYEVQKTLNLTAHQYQMLTIYMSVPSEEKLSDAQMEAVRKAATQAAEEHNAVAFDQEQEIIDALKDPQRSGQFQGSLRCRLSPVRRDLGCRCC